MELGGKGFGAHEPALRRGDKVARGSVDKFSGISPVRSRSRAGDMAKPSLALGERPIFEAGRDAFDAVETALLGDQAEQAELHREALADRLRARRLPRLVVDDGEAAVG